MITNVHGMIQLGSFGGEQHAKESATPTTIGAQVRSVVTGAGNQPEPRYLETLLSPPEAQDETKDGDLAPTLLSALESRYRLTLQAQDNAQLEQALSGAADPTAMALGGLFLAKLGVSLNGPALNALHDAQRGHAAAMLTHSAHRDVSTLIDRTNEGDDDATQELAAVVGDALPESPSQAISFGSGDTGSGNRDSRDSQEFAKLLLNLQDEGNVGYRYGTLPVIVADQLVELDLVVLQQRQQQDGATPARRLIMTLRTESFGKIKIDARALDNRLVVTFTGESAAGADELSARSEELRDLLKRLGWNVEGIGYQNGSNPERAARQIIDHVLSAGTVDMVL
jgi:flagellar hook-length control protein FliK